MLVAALEDLLGKAHFTVRLNDGIRTPSNAGSPGRGITLAGLGHVTLQAVAEGTDVMLLLAELPALTGRSLGGKAIAGGNRE